ncbi:hypothetical protein MGYG_08976 [Nannizzia gypsea CBS 118893]|uniref:Uncharacterized protein n=1 Tax=Arthroderma gypseum (strain ATCC MYA-4604 / CBS 118893) TaxID=535722 RepID=E4URJ7_ARTGP|nr:hypothetical protein MGYG_08976 [Nannizzia gypsea CBS 118893]EFQ99419.1 hypothetical protein MGYG_08976 [Nannizzia gypsea CBS 118893]
MAKELLHPPLVVFVDVHWRRLRRRQAAAVRGRATESDEKAKRDYKTCKEDQDERRVRGAGHRSRRVPRKSKSLKSRRMREKKERNSHLECPSFRPPRNASSRQAVRWPRNSAWPTPPAAAWIRTFPPASTRAASNKE